MPSLTVWIYDTPLGAEAGHRRLKRLMVGEALQVIEAVVVTWVPGALAPRLLHADEAGGPMPGGSVLTTLLDLVPDAAHDPAHDPAHEAPAGTGSLAGDLRRAGIEWSLLEDVGARTVPGSSALWVLSGEVDFDRVRPVVAQAVARGDVVLRHARLPEDGPQALRRIAEALDRGRRDP